MQKFWYFLYYLWNKFIVPFECFHRVINGFLHDMYWYKYHVPKTFGRPYTKTSLMQRIRTAWYYSVHGEP